MDNNFYDKYTETNKSRDTPLEEKEVSGKRKNLYLELTEFLKAHTVYETIPENMKVIQTNFYKKRF